MKFIKNLFLAFYKIVSKLTYFTSVVIISIGLTGLVTYLVGNYYYEKEYQEYIRVQQQWITVDEEYSQYISIIKENLPLIKKHIDSSNYKHDKEFARMKSKELENALKESDYAMTFKDKFKHYPHLLKTSSELIKLTNEGADEKLASEFKKMNQLATDISEHKLVYNKAVKEFQQVERKFIRAYIAELANFQTWNVIE